MTEALNIQAPEPKVKNDDGSTLDLHSIFYTIQGEGPFSGRRAVFIRLAGCNLQCPGCDTEYTKGRDRVPVDDIASRASQAGSTHKLPLIVITGGEPLRQEIGPLCQMLSTAGHHIQIESNGVFAPSQQVIHMILAGWVTLVVSPKTVRIHPDAEKWASAFKYVLDHRSVSPLDGLPIRALEHPAAKGVARPPNGFSGEVFLNPYDAKDETANHLNLLAAAQSCMTYGYRLGVQLHKLIDFE